MANNEFTIPIPARLKNVAKGGHVAGAKDIIDDALGKEQSEINQDRIDDIVEVKGGSTKSIADLSEDIATEKERASGIEAGLRESIDELGQIGLNPDNAISTDGDDFDGDTTAKRSKIPTIGAIIDGNPGVYDVSKRNPTSGPNSDGKFTLEYILANANTLIPTSRRHGGMSIKFVQSSDNKYTQARCMAQNFTTDVTQWQGVADGINAGDNNLAKSGDVYTQLNITNQGYGIAKASLTSKNNYVNVKFNIYTGERYVLHLDASDTSKKATVSLGRENGTSLFFTDQLSTTSDIYFVAQENFVSIKVYFPSSAGGTITIQNNKSLNDRINSVQDNVDSLSDGVDSNRLSLDKKLDLGYTNIIDLTRAIDGAGYVTGGAILRNNSWAGIYAAMLIPWNGNSKICSNCFVGSGGFVVSQFDKNKQYIPDSEVSGTITSITRVNGADYVGVTIYLGQSELRANYGETLLPYDGIANPIQKYLSSVHSDISLNALNITKKVDKKYLNILDTDDIKNGRCFVAGGAIMYNANWVNLFGCVYIPWEESETYITVNSAYCSGGFKACQFDENKTLIDGSEENGISGVHTFTKYANNVRFLGVSLSLTGNPAANYGETFLEDYSKPNAIKGYLLPIEKTINSIVKGSIVKMYAYADGDSANDDDTHFYGWKNNKCAWQRAIDAADGETMTYIYCKGHIEVTQSSQFTLQEDSLYDVVFVPSSKSNIQLIGEGADKTSLFVNMPDDFANYATYEPMQIWGNNILVKGMSIYAKNCRYCIHMDASGGRQADNHTIRFEDLVLRHYHNAKNNYDSTFGLGISDGMNLYMERCKLIQDDAYTVSLYLHDNIKFNKGYVWKIKDCVFEHSYPTSKTNSILLMNIQTLGCGVEGIIEFEDNDIGMDIPIINCQNNNTGTDDLSDYVANNFVRIKGRGNYPIGYSTKDSNSRVLRITSKTVGSGSSVRFDETSSAFNILIKGIYKTDYTENTGIVHVNGYHYRDGVDVLRGYAMGEVALDLNKKSSIQKRLGDCSTNTKLLGITIDGTSYSITFNQDYNSYTDAQMLQVFTDVIGSVADVELYNWGADYFPEIQPSLTHKKNNSESAILCGMGVSITSNGISKATSDDKVDGIAIEDIPPSCFGRVVRKAVLSIFEADHHHVCLNSYPQNDSDKYTSAFQGYFGIGSTPGVFEKKESGPLHNDYWGYLTIDK